MPAKNEDSLTHEYAYTLWQKEKMFIPRRSSFILNVWISGPKKDEIIHNVITVKLKSSKQREHCAFNYYLSKRMLKND